MSNRTLKAPGVELFEHDFSDVSLVDGSTNVLVAGFAPKGEDYAPKTITSLDSWKRMYGTPTNEAEEYFAAAAETVLNNGGILHSVKIPYTNDMTGSYVAARYTIGTVVDLAPSVSDEDSGVDVRDEYRGLHDLGIKTLSIIAPAGSDFLTYEQVGEMEEGERNPGDGTIFIVDKTRATYGNAVQVADVQDNRDSRSCLGILPVMTTLANTAWFQRKSTGLTCDISELYQPVRSIKTIDANSASGSTKYEPTELTDGDLSITLMQTSNAYNRSLSEIAALQAQSCLVDGNMVDGKFTSHVCNDVAVVVFKAFVNPDDSKIDFEVVEQFVGSLNKDEVDENGRSRYIGTIINNKSEYIYFFSTLTNADSVLRADHAFVVGSDAKIEDVEKSLEEDDGYKAAKEFSGDASGIFGFSTIENYNAASSTINVSDPKNGGTYSWAELTEDDVSDSRYWPSGRDIVVPDTIAAEMPTIKYTVTTGNDAEVKLDEDDDIVAGTMPSTTYVIPDAIKDLEFFKLSIFNTTDYIRAVNDFDNIVSESDKDRCEIELGITDDNELKKKMVQLLITNSMENSARYRSLLKKVDDARNSLATLDSKFVIKDYKYISDLYYRLEGQNLLEGISFGGASGAPGPSSASSVSSEEFSSAASGEPDVSWTGTWKLSLGGTYYATVTIPQEDINALRDVEIPTNGEFQELNPPIAVHVKVSTTDTIPNIDGTSSDLDPIPTDCILYVSGITGVDEGGEFIIEDSEVTTSREPGSAYIWTDTNYSGGDAPTFAISGAGVVSPRLLISVGIEELKMYEGLLEDPVQNPTRGAKSRRRFVRKAVKVRETTESEETSEQYIKCRVYLRGQEFNAYRALYEYMLEVLKNCASASLRYLQAKQSVDDANIMLGFYPEMATPNITFYEISRALDKAFESLSNINSTTIDIVVDAGISNIAQFVKQVYDSNDGVDAGGPYEPVKSSANFKLKKSTDLTYWRTIITKYDTFCKSIRRDCMFIADGLRNLVLAGNRPIVRPTKQDTSIENNILPFLTLLNSFNTSYGAGYLNWYKVASSAPNGSILWVPPSIKAAGTYIYTDRNYDWWDAPAGQRRGVIDASDVSFNPTQKQAGEIYDVSWNYAINYAPNTISSTGGIVQEGQKTLQNRASAFDRVNVRRLFLRCERFAFYASQAFLYEPHTELTRSRYVDTLTPFFNDILQRGGIQDFKIICDETNNTPDVIDRNELRAKIGVAPTRTIEWVIIDMVCSRTGTSWTELASV